MENNIVKSIIFLEFVNNISSLINNLLYSQQDGYLTWSAKDSVLNFNNIIKKFDSEVLKLTKNINYSDVEIVVKSKKAHLINEIKKHYENQLFVWADEIFDNLVENALFDLSVDKTKSQEIYNRLIGAVEWLVEIKKSSKETYDALLNQISLKFNSALNSTDYDFIPKETIKKSDSKEFCKLWNMILQDSDKFISEDMSQYFAKLTMRDIKYFENIQYKLQNHKRTVALDEISMIASALEIAKISNFDLMYQFIEQINFDFINLAEQNKIITEEEKVCAIKRRLELFIDKNNKSKAYFKKLFTI